MDEPRIPPSVPTSLPEAQLKEILRQLQDLHQLRADDARRIAELIAIAGSLKLEIQDIHAAIRSTTWRTVWLSVLLAAVTTLGVVSLMWSAVLFGSQQVQIIQRSGP